MTENNTTTFIKKTIKTSSGNSTPDNTLHSNVKERKNSGKPYFHVHVKSIVYGKKIESQKYFSFQAENRCKALTLANAKAIHLCHRHEQIRQARANRVSLTNLFFNENGEIKYLTIQKRVRPKRSMYIELLGQKYIDKKQQKICRTLPFLDPELTSFNLRFNIIFEWLCEHLQVDSTNCHIVFFKKIIASELAKKYNHMKTSNRKLA